MSDPLLGLPGCVSKCDVCGHEPVDCWLLGFGCDACKGHDAVVSETEKRWAAGDNGPINASGGSS